MNPSLLPSLLWGLVAFTFYGGAMVLMKVGTPALAAPVRALQEPALRRKLVAWACGVGLNFGFAGALSLALGLGHASAVSALNGFGLVVVAVLSRLFLKEHIGGPQGGGIALVILGVAAIGLGAPSPVEDAVVAAGDAVWFSAAVALACVLAGALTAWRRQWGGTLVGAAAGALGGVAIVLQKIFVAPLMELGLEPVALASSLLVSPWFWAWTVAATGSFVVLQVAYRFGGASQVAPAMVSTMILVPQGGGPLLFGEVLTAAQVLGTALILGGVVLLTAFPASDPAGEERRSDAQGP